MARIGLKTRKEAQAVCKAFNLGEKLGLKSYETMGEIIRMAKMHHTIQEHHCNGTCSPRNETKERNLESRMTVLATELGLGIRFDGDPRGYTVKLLSLDPKNPIGNTWGGREYGYGVGEK